MRMPPQISGVSAGSNRQCFISSPHQQALKMVGPLAALKLPWFLRKAVGAWRQIAAPVEVALQSCKYGINLERSFLGCLNRMVAVCK